MKIIKKEMLSAILLVSLLFTGSSYAETVACPSAGTCGPCGVEAANATNLPADAAGVNPIVNYAATIDYPSRCRGFWSGFYLGTAWGLGDINYDLKIAGNTIQNMVIPFTSSGLDSATRSYLVTNFNAGVNLVLDYFLLGVEVGYDYRSRNNPISYWDLADSITLALGVPPIILADLAVSVPCKIRLDINSQHAATVDILPGFAYSRFSVYLRLGVEQSTYTWNRRVCFPSIVVNETPGAEAVVIQGQDFIQTIKKTKDGFRAGIGFGIAADEHFSFHLNYIHTFGTKITFTPDVTAIAANVPVVIFPVVLPTTTFISLGQLAADNTIEPQRNEVLFGVRFRF